MLTADKISAIHLMTELGCPKTMAFIITYLYHAGWKSIKEISYDTGIAQPHISTSVKVLREKYDLLSVREDTQGRISQIRLVQLGLYDCFETITNAEYTLNKLKGLLARGFE